MQYDDIIRIQNSIDLKYIKEASKTINNAEIQSRINELRKAIEPLCNMKIWETQSVSKQLSNVIKMSSLRLYSTYSVHTSMGQKQTDYLHKMYAPEALDRCLSKFLYDR